MSLEWPAFLAWLKTLWPSLLGVLKLLAAGKAGQVYQQGKDAQHEIEVLGLAAEALRHNKSRPVADRLRDAHERGLYRVFDESTDNKRG